jgi:GNAT superfamily N-acetyltransferase
MTTNGHHHEPLPPPTTEAYEGYLASLIDALGDTPETVIPLQFLREGTCEIMCVGDPADLEGVIVQAFETPEEPIAFGSSAEAVAGLLPHLSGWSCVNVPLSLVDDLIGPVAEIASASHVRLLDDVYHVLTSPVAQVPIDHVRLLTADDHRLVLGASPELVGAGAERLIETVDAGHVAGAIREGTLVSLAHTFATSELHADIGVVTHPDWRGHGLGTAVSAVVAKAIQDDGRIPVWSCGATNAASMRIAAALGFREVSRRVYLIPEFGDSEGGT